MARVKFHIQPGSMRNQCPGCGEGFNGMGPFDGHRTGAFGSGTRRCLTVPEMLASGYRQLDGGWWSNGVYEAAPDVKGTETTAAA